MAPLPSPLSPPASDRSTGAQSPPSGAHELGVKDRSASGS